MNRFKIIITSYNNEEWTEICLNSVLTQTYTNFEVIFFDDSSSDNTHQIANTIISNDKRFKIIHLDENKTKSWIFVNLLDKYIDDNDIVLFLDGDDWISSDEVLNTINQYYETYNFWVAYGGMVVWNGGDEVKEPFPQNSIFPNEVLQKKLFRLDTWRSSHTKTMKGFVWKSLNKTNFISKLDNRYILGPDDLVIMFDALEKCPTNKIGRFDFPTYVYNHSEKNIDRIHKHQSQRNVNYESEIRNRPIEPPLLYITSELSGGVGNQLFKIAATISAAKNFGYTAIFDPTSHFLPLQGRNINVYNNNIFRNIIFDTNFSITHEFNQNGFHYEEISNILPYTILKGGFQTEKYFDKELVKNTFSCPIDIEKYINDKYNLTNEDITCIHVRRGDYLKLAPYHIVCDKEYYYNAIDIIKSNKYLVFSDDLSWCKDVFKGNEYTFIFEEDYIELYMMSKCKNNIISNSTFSWWGAWLNENTNKKVIAPNKWFGTGYSHWNISDLIPTNWIKL